MTFRNTPETSLLLEAVTNQYHLLYTNTSMGATKHSTCKPPNLYHTSLDSAVGLLLVSLEVSFFPCHPFTALVSEGLPLQTLYKFY